MTNFMAAVESNCRRVDWIGVRWQGPANFHHFREYITLIYDTYRRPLMLTALTLDDEEFHSEAEALTFMKQVLPWLEQSTFVDGYAWLPKANTSSALVRADGSLTACGDFYTSVNADNPNGNQLIPPDDPSSF
jgi:Glycosyl hydrolase catalytic core